MPRAAEADFGPPLPQIRYKSNMLCSIKTGDRGLWL